MLKGEKTTFEVLKTNTLSSRKLHLATGSYKALFNLEIYSREKTLFFLRHPNSGGRPLDLSAP